MANYPTNLRYTKDHEWIRLENGKVRVGITTYAVQQLGDITLVDLPAVGTLLKAHERFGDIESVKAVSELFAPVSGKVFEVNAELVSAPELVNTNAYEQGWMIVIEPSNAAEVESLMDAVTYETYVAGLD